MLEGTSRQTVVLTTALLIAALVMPMGVAAAGEDGRYPEATYVLVNWVEHTRRIYTDGRDWPEEIEPTLTGYSIGQWIDPDHDGHYDVLEVETRGFKGPRYYDADGLPLHHDNQSVFKERFYLDKADKNILHDAITVIDRALTRPWTMHERFNSDAV